ncbi:hypothetical protein [Aurantibacillus circumpalustris]|uniref:hypothetical protein n=1 Tax=Aurantibacillus circumpalustris TaxID=3036359 RepID=UPI00295A8FB3|nr:hypothetical protein [Aurantibacillus circumpalustris]
MINKLVAFLSGWYATFLHFLGSSYVEAAIKGLIGGLTGYLGTVLMTWIIKKVKTKNKP